MKHLSDADRQASKQYLLVEVTGVEVDKEDGRNVEEGNTPSCDFDMVFDEYPSSQEEAANDDAAMNEVELYLNPNMKIGRDVDAVEWWRSNCS